jgi:diguanylate cyclase (GGDEF)-like protein
LADLTFLGLDEIEMSRKAAIERIRVFNERSITAARLAFVGIALMAWVMGSQASSARAVVWVSVISLVELLIVLAGLGCRRALEGASDSQYWLRVQLVLASVSGVVWGSAVWFVWVPGQFIPYLATLTILVGVAGVSIITMSSYAAAAIFFFAGIYLVPLLHEVVYPKAASEFLGIGMLVIMVVQIGYARSLGRMVQRELDQFVRNEALVDRLNALVTHDQLTGAFSRRYILERLEQQVSVRQRHGTAASLIMFDLDNFKAINDHYGHPAGDRALQEVVRAVNAQLRDGDMLARVGGEEFLVLLPMTDIQAAVGLAERLRQTLEATFIVEGTKKIHLPASFGVAEMQPKESFTEWFGRVDALLYQAKDQGRNSVRNAD